MAALVGLWYITLPTFAEPSTTVTLTADASEHRSFLTHASTAGRPLLRGLERSGPFLLPEHAPPTTQHAGANPWEVRSRLASTGRFADRYGLAADTARRLRALLCVWRT